MSSKFATTHVEDEPISATTRTAIDTSGCLGSLYDQYQDQILEKLDKIKKKSKTTSRKTVRCKIINGKTEESENLLRMIGIQDDLRLSILLKLVPRVGIASLIDYSHAINEHVRFLHYTYIHREENLPKDLQKIKKPIKSIISQTTVTHIITGVSWGIDVLVVLPLPSDSELVGKSDTIFGKLERALIKSSDSNLFSATELNEIKITNVYSNIPILTKAASLYDIYEDIYHLKKKYVEHRPVHYTLRPIQEIFAKNTSMNDIIFPLDALCNNKIEQNFLQILTSIKYLETYFNQKKSNILEQYCAQQLHYLHISWLDVKRQYVVELERFAKLLVDWRQNHPDLSHIEMILNDDQQRILKRNIDELIEAIKQLEAKEKLIVELQKQNFQYWNIAGYNFNEHDNQQIVEQTLIRDNRADRFLCSNDTLKQDKPAQFDQLRDQVVKEHQINTNLRLVYADFSYSSFTLSDIIVLPNDNMNKTEGMNNHNISPRCMELQMSYKSSSEEFINILLLGESGVGKSTFINAFANYLTYETLQEAESKKSLVIIPVSFVITVGNNFDEHTVKFGESDTTNNEDFDHPGQSVTQHCKSYIFNCKRTNGKKLRIIDTPGFGDTRGLDQDDLNMQHILEYINNLTHLNAVCFLLKPNVSRLNNYFRTCFTQLLDFLGPNARQNITFCFTNSRCTFYTPGDTAAPLRTLLNTFSVKDIPFTKTNTFSFDSESFRYLVALKNAIKFTELDRNEYEKSWITSTTESNRLIDYICQDRMPYNIHDRWKSIQHARMEIIHMIRPIFETIRNTLRNILLIRMKFKNMSIQLNTRSISSPITLCLACKPKLISVANFWITSDDLHGPLKKCLMCKCAPNQHISIDYTLNYTPSDNPEAQDESQLIDQVSLLFNASVESARFLKITDYSSKDDPFMNYLNRMIWEEKHICAEKNPLNISLLEDLEKLKNKYESRICEMKTNQDNIELAVIYERIHNTRNYPGVQQQMNTVKESQANLMKFYENEISNNHINNSCSITV